MTNLELRTKLEAAQLLLSDVYHWASQKETILQRTVNPEIERLMSVADSCIIDALDELEDME
jgi:hypothetical protein